MVAPSEEDLVLVVRLPRVGDLPVAVVVLVVPLPVVAVLAVVLVDLGLVVDEGLSLPVEALAELLPPCVVDPVLLEVERRMLIMTLWVLTFTF